MQSVELSWYGCWGRTATHGSVCTLDKPMGCLDIKDIVPSSGILYREARPGVVKIKKDGVLHANSLKALQYHLPKVGEGSPQKVRKGEKGRIPRLVEEEEEMRPTVGLMTLLFGCLDVVCTGGGGAHGH